MQQNLGTADRIMRVVAAIVIAALYFLSVITGTIGVVLLVLAVVLTSTSLLGYCPLYAIAGINTCHDKA